MSQSKAKIVLIGDGCTGKTTYFNDIIHYQDPEYAMTRKYIATEYLTAQDIKEVTLPTNQGDISFHLWDTAGQEKFGALRDAYLRGADGIILMYDVSERKTLENVFQWINNINHVCHDKLPAVICVGNKMDLMKDLPSLLTVKLRKSTLQGKYHGPWIENQLISIKERTCLETIAYWFSSEEKIFEEKHLVPIEKLLSQIYRRNITLSTPKYD